MVLLGCKDDEEAGVQHDPHTVSLEWDVSNAVNVDYFNVYKVVGDLVMQIGSVDAAGSHTAITNFRFSVAEKIVEHPKTVGYIISPEFYGEIGDQCDMSASLLLDGSDVFSTEVKTVMATDYVELTYTVD